ncbi:MAG: hypothetical protein PUE71_09210 [Clostridia bacterium]|nr:hypothetical protein [Clostridia bacterium]
MKRLGLTLALFAFASNVLLGGQSSCMLSNGDNIQEESYNVDYNTIKYDALPGIACWGDSMMEGVGSEEGYIFNGSEYVDIGYCTTPSVIEQFTGIRTYNFGVAGETSYDIAVRAGGIPVFIDRDITITRKKAAKAYLYDEYGNIYNAEDYSGYGTEQNDYYNTCYINGFLCNIKNVNNSGMVEISLCDSDINGNKKKLSIPANTAVISKAAYEHRNDILVIEMGSNDGWDNDYSKLILQYKQIISSSNCAGYIIVGDTDNPGESLADYNQSATYDDGSFIGTGDTYWEAALREAFGEHFLNTRVYLLENGLSDCGFTPSEEDLNNIEMGFIPESLRSDYTHFNAYGYYSKGKAIYLKGVELGYWN